MKLCLTKNYQTISPCERKKWTEEGQKMTRERALDELIYCIEEMKKINIMEKNIELRNE